VKSKAVTTLPGFRFIRVSKKAHSICFIVISPSGFRFPFRVVFVLAIHSRKFGTKFPKMFEGFECLAADLIGFATGPTLFGDFWRNQIFW